MRPQISQIIQKSAKRPPEISQTTLKSAKDFYIKRNINPIGIGFYLNCQTTLADNERFLKNYFGLNENFFILHRKNKHSIFHCVVTGFKNRQNQPNGSESIGGEEV